MKNLHALLILMTAVACGRQGNPASEPTPFHVPIVLQPNTKDTIAFFEGEYISDAWPIFVGKSRFCDTLQLSIGRDGSTRHNTDFMYERTFWGADSLKTDGLELFPDYKTNVARIEFDDQMGKYFYPVYVVNQTPTTKVFVGKDGYVFAIQEALDADGNWHPIEGRGFDFCGNGYWGLKIHPQEFLTFLMPKYRGDFATKLRVRIKIGDTIYVSKPFEGTIHEKQFLLDRKHGFHYVELLEDRAGAIQDLFYGAQPLEAGDEGFGVQGG